MIVDKNQFTYYHAQSSFAEATQGGLGTYHVTVCVLAVGFLYGHPSKYFTDTK